MHQRALKVIQNGRPVNIQLKIDKQKTSSDQDHDIVDKGQTLSNETRNESNTKGNIFPTAYLF